MKFSIIIPVYNVEDYIIKCLESIVNQTYNNYEVIIVNDGSPDNSETLINKFIKGKKNFRLYKKENGGLSDARNYGLKYVSGDYMMFIDSDDFIKKDLLFNLNTILTKKKYDLVKFNFIDLEHNQEKLHLEKIENNQIVKINDIIYFDYFEPACGYCYNTNFYKQNNFEFSVGKYHEDYGLIPLIVSQAKSIYYLNYFGYVYLKRENSITNDKSKNIKKAYDVLEFSINNINKIKTNKVMPSDIKNLLLNFYANGAIGKTKLLDNKKEYIKELKRANICSYLASNTIKEKIKKIVCKLSYNLYIKLF